jgi:hypothetical protein
MRAVRATLISMALLASAIEAGAQSVEQQAAARARFEEGIKKMRRHEFTAACPLLEESLELAADMTTAFRLAECYELTRRPGLAWRYYTEVADAAGRAGMDERRDYAKLHAEALAPRLARLTVEIPSTPPDLEVELDDRPLARALWNAEMRIEPGTHVLRAHAPGHHPWEESVDIPTRKTQAHVVVMLEALPPPPPAPPAPSAPPAWAPPPAIGITLTSVGAASLFVGVVLAGTARARYDESLDGCVDDSCTDDALALQDEAVTLGDAATGLFVFGALTTATGVGFWLATALLRPAEASEDPEEEPAVSIGIGAGVVVLRGRM